MRCSDGVVLVCVEIMDFKAETKGLFGGAGVARSLARSLSLSSFFLFFFNLSSLFTFASLLIPDPPPPAPPQKKTKKKLKILATTTKKTNTHKQGVENLFVSKMLEPGTNTRTHPVSRHAGVALSGVAADGRQVALRAQGEALGYKNTYGSPIPGKILCDRVASYVHAFNLYWYVRPFGCVTLLATFDDEEGPALYAIDPAGGAFVSCFFLFV